jgi:hypothetical protein
MPSEITVRTGFGEYVFQEVQVTYEANNVLLVKRSGTPLLWASWPWQVIFT